ncbi:MAG: diguanylate cyclase [Acidothermus sp.]|nr:diguanylate cyclase [Acidothermus sp.]MCL6537972.1 diguanylate cyclase [Acidothermus sp.]
METGTTTQGTATPVDDGRGDGGVAELAAALESIESRLAGQTSELVRLRRNVELSQALLDLHVACTRQRSVAGTARQVAAIASALLRAGVVVVPVFDTKAGKPLLGVSIGDGIVDENHLADVACRLVGEADLAWMRTENRLAVLTLDSAEPFGATLLAELHAERALLAPLFGQGEFVGCIVAKLPKSVSVVDDIGLFEAAGALQNHAGDLLHLALVLDELRRRALHDAVTGLPNLAVYEQRLVRALARQAAKQDGHREVASIVLQVMGMGRVTEAHGATGAQAVLREIAARLLEIAPEHDLGHLGASHFALIAHGEPGAGVDLARTAIQTLEEPLDLPFGELRLHCHVGVAAATESETAGELLRRAETAARIARTTDEQLVVDG